MSLPHARGGVSELTLSACWTSSSSPRTWGCFLSRHQAAFLCVVFPTHVGVFLTNEELQAVLAESSPRTWGCFPGILASHTWRQVFPTHVGVFPL